MKIAVFGASGYLGTVVRKLALAAGHDVVGFCLSDTDDELVRVDIRDATAVRRTVGEAAAQVVVNAAARQDDWATTAIGAVNVAAAASLHGAKTIHVSSDAVFSDAALAYDEHAVPAPATTYGAAKAAAEIGVAAACDDAVIIRTSWILGDGNSWFERFAQALARGERDGVLYDDDFRCPVHPDDLAAAILELAGLDYRGVLNVAGADAANRLELGRMVALRDGLDPAILRRGSKSADGPGACRVLLDSGRARRLLRTRLRGADEFMTQAPRRTGAANGEHSC